MTVIRVGNSRVNLSRVTTYRHTWEGSVHRITFNFDGIIEMTHPEKGNVVRVNSYTHKCEDKDAAMLLLTKIDELLKVQNV